jgi:hypothetical protein
MFFDNQRFVGATFKYSFENYDIPSFPSMGMGFFYCRNLENECGMDTAQIFLHRKLTLNPKN